MEGVRGIRAWRWLFYIEGSATIFVALLTVFSESNLPDRKMRPNLNYTQ